jgi:hypothetical protein
VFVCATSKKISKEIPVPRNLPEISPVVGLNLIGGETVE